MNKDLNELKRLAAELGEEIKRLEAAPKSWPQDGDGIFIINESGRIYEFLYQSGYVLKTSLKQGNGFRTSAEAEAEKHCRDVACKLIQQAGARKFVKGRNLCLLWNLEDGLYPGMRELIPNGIFSIYFDTEQQVEAAVAAVGEKEIMRAIRWKELGETS